VQVLHQLPKFTSPNLLVGTETADDAGVYQLRPDLAIVNTVDFFTPIVDDPYMFGQIAATNSLSDVYAMGGEPTTALNIVCFPKGKMDIEVLGEVLRGGADKVIESGAVIVGGHSIIDEEIKYGLAVTGTVHPDRVLRNVGAREGDVLILTKPLGTGIATTALKRGNASKASIDQAVASMATLNKYAADVMKHYDVHACSDITGYGLLGHGLEMTTDSISITFEAARLPLIQDVAQLAETGNLTGGCKRNREFLDDKMVIGDSVSDALTEVALDPQTSGGLLIAVSEQDGEPLVNALTDNNIPAAVVGTVSRRQERGVRLV
jgi:selenide,water dikinase